MVIHKFNMDLQRSGITPIADAVQGDVNSRTLELSLYQAKKAFLLPDDLEVLIRYKKADGRGGEYDTLPDGLPAWSADRNKLTIHLAPQVLTFPGSVSMSITLVSGGKQVSTFPISVNVLPSAKALTADSEDYFNITGFLVAPANAKPGQFLKVTAVNSAGRVTQIEADLPEQMPSDWNAAEGQPGHILNRPFYSECAYGTILAETTPVYDESEGSFFIMDALSLTAGVEYTVSWNDVNYACTSVEFPIGDSVNGVVLGNLSAMNEELPDTGEPFVMVVIPSEFAAIVGFGAMILPLDGSTSPKLSISGNIETVVPIPAKYLGNVRGQKAITLDLDNMYVNISLDTIFQMDPGEVQSAATVIYEGAEYSLSAVSLAEELIGDFTYRDFGFTFMRSEGVAPPYIVRASWNNYNGMQILSTTRTIQLPNPDSDTLFYVKRVNDGGTVWRTTSDMSVDGIMLNSTTPGSNLTFWVTVDDSGTLTATQKYM